jgi:hypothetical protein
LTPSARRTTTPLCQGCATRSPVRVGRQPVMSMAVDVVVGLSALGGRVHVYRHTENVRDVMEHLVANFLRHPMPLRDRYVGVHGDIQFDRKTMADPASSHFGDIADAWHVPRGVLGGVQDLRVHPVEHPGKHGVRGLPDQVEDDDCDQKPHQRVSQRIA